MNIEKKPEEPAIKSKLQDQGEVFWLSDEQKKLLADLKQKTPVEIYVLCAGELDKHSRPTDRASVAFVREPTFAECQNFLDNATDDKSKGKSAVVLLDLCLLHPQNVEAIPRPGHVVALANRFLKVAGITADVTQGK